MAVTFRIFLRALKLALVEQTWTLVTNYIQVPLGIIALLIPCWAVNLGLVKLSIIFPPSIICMAFLFILLLFTHYLFPNSIFQSIYKNLKPACNWSLGTVGIFMTPSFITLSTNTDLSSKQIGFLIAFFLPPLLITWVIDIMICKLIAKALPFSVDDIYNYEHLDHPGDSSHGSSSPKRSIRMITSSRPHPHLNEDARWVATPSPEPGLHDPDKKQLDTRSLVEAESPLSRGWTSMSTARNRVPKDPQSPRGVYGNGEFAERKNPSKPFFGHNSNFFKDLSDRHHRQFQMISLINRRTHRKFNSDPIIEYWNKAESKTRARSISLTLSLISRKGNVLTENDAFFSTSQPIKDSTKIFNAQDTQKDSVQRFQQGMVAKEVPSSSGSWGKKPENSRQAVTTNESRSNWSEKQKELVPFPTLDSQFQSATVESGAPYRTTRRKRIPTALIHYEASIVDVEVIPEPISRPAISIEFALSRRIARIFDLIFYVILTGIGIVLFYTPGGTERSQVLFIGVISLIWLFSRRIIPESWTKILHPALTTSLISAVAIMGIGASRGLTARETFDRFYYDRTYLDLFNPIKGGKVEVMGAGDILESVLDAGTVGLAFTVFDYRKDLYRNFFRVILVVLPNCCLSLTAWPFVARHLNVIPSQAIDFAGRSMSAPLTLELLKAVDGNKNLGVVLVYLTGLTVSFLRAPMFRFFKIRPASLEEHEDYFTIGATVGAVGGVIGTSSLLKRHRRAAGTATVTLVLYAVIMLTLVAVHPVSRFVSGLAGVTPSESE